MKKTIISKVENYEQPDISFKGLLLKYGGSFYRAIFQSHFLNNTLVKIHFSCRLFFNL